MVVVDAESVMVTRWVDVLSPYLSTGYWLAVPKSQPSCVPDVTGSRSMSQSLKMSVAPVP